MELLYMFWDNFSASFTVRLFVCSFLILVCGLSFKVWLHVVRLSFLDDMDLKKVEKEHPHIPRIKTILSILGTTFALIIVGMTTVSAFPAFDGPYESLYIIGLFLLMGTAGILAEMHWEEIKWYIYAFLSGSSLAFVFFVVGYFHQAENLSATTFFIAMLLTALGFMLHLLKDAKNKNVPIIFVVTFLVWMGIYLL